MQNPNFIQINGSNLLSKIAKVPGNLSCAAHAFILGFLWTAVQNPVWFLSIRDKFDYIVRRIYGIDGNFECYEIRSHLLREQVDEFVSAKGQDFFRRLFGQTWYWGNEVSANIAGRNFATFENPVERDFMEHANPFFMVCSIIFNCQIRVVTRNRGYVTFSVPNCQGPIVNVFSDMENRAGIHFDALLPLDAPQIWFPNPDSFTEPGVPYVGDDGNIYCDVVSRIDKFYEFLGHRYSDVLSSCERFRIRQEEADRALANRLLQEEEDSDYAAKLNRQLNGY